MLTPLHRSAAAPALQVLPRHGTAPGATPQGWPLLRLGFRPFYLAASAWAVLALALWAAMLAGWVALPSEHATARNPVLWHAHEMLFGFAATVVVGFVLTAAKAWTGLATARGPALGALVLLWLGARATALGGPYLLHALLDVALLPAVALQLLVVLLRARNRRNLPLVGLLLVLGSANAA